jgi:phage baseplate assembly protein W
MANDVFLGYDLDLGFIADEEGRVFAGPYTHVDLRTALREGVAPRSTDVGVVSGKANLVQSLIMRLQTEQEELAGLGHPGYGSRHHRLIGEPNVESNRNLIKLYVLECVKQEPRLESVLKIDVKAGQGRENRDKVDITISVKAKGLPDALSFVVPFSFGGALG